VRVETVIIGAGQAGLALSHELRAADRGHVVLERGRVGERWRSERWESMHLLTPNRLNRLPGAPPLPDPDGYLDRDGIVAYLASYAVDAAVREHTTVLHVRRATTGYDVTTDCGQWRAANVVVATGDCDVPRRPGPAAAAPPSVLQLHAVRYRRPDQLPPGAVLVVGAGPTGQQLALELRSAGRRVAIAVGRHARMPRRYRGRDSFAWLDVAGLLAARADEVRDLAAARRAPSFPVSGQAGGESLGLDRLATLGVTVTGRLVGFAGRHALFAPNLEHELRDADRRLRRTLAQIDAHIERSGADAGQPEWPAPVALPPGPPSLDLRDFGTVLWATGYTRAYPWLDVPVLDGAGQLVHREGVTAAHGLYALGLRFQRTRRSHFIGGVGNDAARIADAITGAAMPARAA
jgi:putative flavoprotein involved in K+ transport